MTGLRRGSFRLFRFSGIDVFLHWSWFLVAAFEINSRKSSYSSVGWNVAEYMALFLIVTLHEFGHALACRQVGGTSDHIVLWPLGGVAYVNPPPRPGATLWSLAAGPLVNVGLIPILWGLGMMSRSMGWEHDAGRLVYSIWWINLGLLIFNMLPIYPLDGGQILRSLLWFVMGRGRSLMVATILGLVGVVGFIVFAFWAQSPWFAILAVFILLNSWSGLKQAQALLRLGKLPRHIGFACPSCKAAPPVGNLWICGNCRNSFDTFQTQALCPHCAEQFGTTRCVDCGRVHPMSEWIAAVPLHPAV
jgi:Zn-dependent protease